MKQRNNKGRYARDYRLTRGFTFVIGICFAIVIAGIGVSRVSQWFLNTVGLTVSVENAQAEEDPLVAHIKSAAHLNHISWYQLYRTAECESNFIPRQSEVIKNGRRENSWGIFQINLTAHPEVSRDEAMDNEFAIFWSAQHFNTVTWYAYDRVTDTCN